MLGLQLEKINEKTRSMTDLSQIAHSLSNQEVQRYSDVFTYDQNKIKDVMKKDLKKWDAVFKQVRKGQEELNDEMRQLLQSQKQQITAIIEGKKIRKFELTEVKLNKLC